ncbi:hypothetical protein GCM10010873_24240 [Cypionkella aquatica]|uniref:Hedgehog/Intein (Hint) domain-containing protein n=1 Tax=Cypionkella aquatica TaxID=1756042 RepID=A0AA37TWU8_9RHOB|nr:Hint domain-containing protein [Cypionkella aquatica]GLS87450.1 hypothetical protein GCM10010873_24240 [Cypionkella aquatica]
MAQTDVIQNGSFDAGSAGWTGTDLETTYAESAYLGNGSVNRVAEMDGQTGQTTVMEQVFQIAHAQTATLTFDTALRTDSLGNAGVEGFRVEVLDASGTVIATQDYLPTAASFTAQSLSVSFPGAGDYTLRFTELGLDDSLGAIVDNISMLVCFAAGTLIETDRGARAVESLQPGDLVWTLDGGLQPVRWIASRAVSVAEQEADARLRPVVFDPGSLGQTSLGHVIPQRRLAVSPQHRMLLTGWQAELLFGQSEVLVAAHSLINGGSIRQAGAAAPVCYVHFLLDGHQIVCSDGALCESFFPTRLSLAGVEREARTELLRLFPDLASLQLVFAQTARPVIKPQEARLLTQLAS